MEPVRAGMSSAILIEGFCWCHGKNTCNIDPALVKTLSIMVCKERDKNTHYMYIEKKVITENAIYPNTQNMQTLALDFSYHLSMDVILG